MGKVRTQQFSHIYLKYKLTQIRNKLQLENNEINNKPNNRKRKHSRYHCRWRRQGEKKKHPLEKYKEEIEIQNKEGSATEIQLNDDWRQVIMFIQSASKSYQTIEWLWCYNANWMMMMIATLRCNWWWWVRKRYRLKAETQRIWSRIVNANNSNHFNLILVN